MKGKYKLISLFIIMVILIIPMINLFGQSSNFTKSDFVQDIIGIVEKYDHKTYEIEIVSLTAPEENRSFYNQSAIYKIQTELVIDEKDFLGNGMYFSGIFIDSDGVFDLGEMFFTPENNKGYTPIVYPDPKKNEKYQTFYGTTTGTQILIGILAKEIPYFGNIYNNQFGKNQRARNRYIENIIKQLKDTEAHVFVLEYDVNPGRFD
jgi:hypothetical protein